MNQEKKEYFPNGNIRSCTTYVNGIKHGPYSTYHSDGTLFEKGDYLSDMKHGVYEQYYPNGTLMQTGEYFFCFKHGPYKMFEDNGQISETGTYNKGAKYGPYEHYENGFLKERGLLESNKMVGYHQWFYENGQLQLRGNFNLFGQFEGTFDFFDIHGQLIETVPYLNNIKHGKYLLYRDGYLIEEGKYVNGARTIQREYFDDIGKLKENYQITNSQLDGEHKEYFENGNLKLKKTYFKGKLHGLYESYASFGKNRLEQKGMFINNRREGFVTFFMFDLTGVPDFSWIDEVIIFENGIRKSYINYFSDSTIREKGVFSKDGLKVPTETYNQN